MRENTHKRFVTSPIFLIALLFLCLGLRYLWLESVAENDAKIAAQSEDNTATKSVQNSRPMPTIRGNICEIPGDHPGLNDKHCPSWEADVGYPCQCPDKTNQIGAVCSNALSVDSPGACRAESKPLIPSIPKVKVKSPQIMPTLPQDHAIAEPPSVQPEPVALPLPPENPETAHAQYLKRLKKGEFLLGTKGGGARDRGDSKWDACRSTERKAQEHCAIGLKTLGACACEREYSGKNALGNDITVWSCELAFECLPNANGEY